MKNVFPRLEQFFRKKFASVSPEGIHLREVARWKADRAEEKRYVYNLGPGSIVFDMGGYEGQFASDLYSRYRPKIYVFEPVMQFADNIRKRFHKNHDIRIYPFGLSDKTGDVSISLDENSSSLFLSRGASEKVHMMKASDFFGENNISGIDLMKINIEGGEYALLEDLIGHNLVKNIKNLQIQFHTFVPRAEERMKKIQEALKKTHHITYQYPFVWENWEIN
jgi:FkbM family methyltransferase